MPLRNNYHPSAYEVWNQNSETARNNADTRRMEIDNQTLMARNLVEMLYKQASTQAQAQTAIQTQAENQANAMPTGPQGQRADIYKTIMELKLKEQKLADAQAKPRREREMKKYEQELAIAKEKELLPKKLSNQQTLQTQKDIAAMERAKVETWTKTNVDINGRVVSGRANTKTGEVQVREGRNWVAAPENAKLAGTGADAKPPAITSPTQAEKEIVTRLLDSDKELDELRGAGFFNSAGNYKLYQDAVAGTAKEISKKEGISLFEAAQKANEQLKPKIRDGEFSVTNPSIQSCETRRYNGSTYVFDGKQWVKQ